MNNIAVIKPEIIDALCTNSVPTSTGSTYQQPSPQPTAKKKSWFKMVADKIVAGFTKVAPVLKGIGYVVVAITGLVNAVCRYRELCAA